MKGEEIIVRFYCGFANLTLPPAQNCPVSNLSLIDFIITYTYKVYVIWLKKNYIAAFDLIKTL